MKYTVYIRQTPYGSVQWQLFDMSQNRMVANSMDFDTRSEALTAVKEHFSAMQEATVIDQTPQALAERKYNNEKKA